MFWSHLCQSLNANVKLALQKYHHIKLTTKSKTRFVLLFIFFFWQLEQRQKLWLGEKDASQTSMVLSSTKFRMLDDRSNQNFHFYRFAVYESIIYLTVSGWVQIDVFIEREEKAKLKQSSSICKIATDILQEDHYLMCLSALIPTALAQ